MIPRRTKALTRTQLYTHRFIELSFTPLKMIKLKNQILSISNGRYLIRDQNKTTKSLREISCIKENI